MFCTKCGEKNAESANFCKKCGTKLNTNMVGEKSIHSASSSKKKQIDSDVPPYPYVISISKLVILSILTFGLYEIYWFYKHFKSFKSESDWNITPWVRAIFAVFNSMVLFRHVSDLAKKYDKNKGIQVTALALAFFILNLLWRLPDPYWLLSLLTFLPLIPVQNTINFYWREKYGEGLKESSFSLGNWVAAIIGGVILVLAIYGTIYPEEVQSISDQETSYRSNFIQSCISEDPDLMQFCSCGADYLLTNYSLEQLNKMDEEYSNTGQQAQPITNTIKNCEHLIP
jgi:hypothetical protein